eukprot:10732820-Heterocapsa_arctica.AAC.1
MTWVYDYGQFDEYTRYKSNSRHAMDEIIDEEMFKHNKHKSPPHRSHFGPDLIRNERAHPPERRFHGGLKDGGG